MNRQAALDIQMNITSMSQDIRLNVTRASPEITMTIDKSVTPPETYDGPYEVQSILYDEATIPTAFKMLERDVTVLPIRIYEVSNPQGGRTVTIGTV